MNNINHNIISYRSLLLRYIFIIFFITGLYLSLYPSDVQNITESYLIGKIPAAETWRINFTDNLAFADPAYDDTTWLTTTLPFDPAQYMNHGNQFLWLRYTFRITKINPEKKIFLLTGKVSGAIEYYINGVLAGFHGSFPPHYQQMESSPKQFLIPAQLIIENNDNIISIRIYNNRGIKPIPEFYFGDYNAYLIDSQLIDFFSVKIYLVYSVVCFLLALYFLFQFILRQKERPSLFFFLSNFCFSLYFMNMGLEVSFLPYKFASIFSQSFLPLFFGFLVLFFVNYFNLHNNKWFKRIILGLAFLLFILFYFNSGEKDLIPNLFTYALLPSALELIFMVYLSIRATIMKKPFAAPIMFGALMGFIFGVHDMAHQFANTRPLFWLQGTGIFCFNLSMFIALSLRNIKAYKDLEHYSKDIVHKSEALTMYIQNIKHVAETVSNISTQLETTIISTSGSIEKMASGSMHISRDMKNQYHIVQTTNDAILFLLNSLEEIFTGLTNQFNHVQNTSITIEQMIKNILQITEKLKNTSDLAEDLKEKTKKGKNIVLSSAKSVEEIIAVSKDAYKIIDSVSDLAEQTNILAINAAIEAAHAGKYGKGFSIVANEIKRLATGSTQQSAEILDRIKDIIYKIEQSAKANTHVKDVFEEINSKTKITVDQIQSIYSSIHHQKRSSEQVLKSISELNSSSQVIKTQADKQQSSGHLIRDNVHKLVESSHTVLNNITEISEEIEEIVKSTNNIKSIAGESIKLITRLKVILEKKDGVQ